jgi:hypothetical protein
LLAFAVTVYILRQEAPMPRKPTKYRPGIDDPPPTRMAWLAGIIGLTALASVAAALLKKFRRG